MKKASIILGLFALMAFVPVRPKDKYLKYIDLPEEFCAIKKGDTLAFNITNEDTVLTLEFYHGQPGNVIVVK